MSLPVTTAPTCSRPLAPWRQGWGRRHTVAALVLLPGVSWFYASSAGSVTGPAQVTALVLLAGMGAITLATYVRPVGGLARPVMSPCAAAAPFQMLVAAVCLFLGADLPLRWLTALVLAGAALAQRTTGSSTCAIGAGRA